MNLKMLFRKNTIVFILVMVFPYKSWTQIQKSSKIRAGISGFYEKSGAFALVPDKQKVFNYGGQVDYRLGNSKKLIESGVVLLTRRVGIGDSRCDYIQIPIKYKMEFLFFYFAIGGYVDVFYGYEGGRLYVEKGNKYGYLFNLGIQQNIYENWNLFIVLESTNNITKEQFNNYGVGFGVNYVLK